MRITPHRTCAHLIQRVAHGQHWGHVREHVLKHVPAPRARVPHVACRYAKRTNARKGICESSRTRHGGKCPCVARCVPVQQRTEHLRATASSRRTGSHNTKQHRLSPSALTKQIVSTYPTEPTVSALNQRKIAAQHRPTPQGHRYIKNICTCNTWQAHSKPTTERRAHRDANSASQDHHKGECGHSDRHLWERCVTTRPSDTKLESANHT